MYLVSFLSLFAITCVFLSSRRPLWNDEIYTFFVAGQPTAGGILRILMDRADNQPPLYPLLVHVLLPVLGSRELAVRLPTVAGFCLMCWSIFEFTRRRLPRAYAAAAMMIACVACFHFATEGRPYGLNLGCSGLALVCWQRAAESRPRAAALTGLFLSLNLAVALHYFFIFLLAPLMVGELVRAVRSGKADWPMWAVLFSPLLVLAAHLPLISRVTPSPLAESRLTRIGEGYSYLFPRPINLRVLIVIPVLAAYAAWKLAPRRRERPDAFPLHEWLAISSLALLPVGIVIVTVLSHSMFFPRYSLVANIGCAILAAAVVFRVFRGSKPAVIGFLVLLFALLCARVTQGFLAGDNLRFATELRRELTKIPGNSQPVVVVDPASFTELALYPGRGLKGQIVFALDAEQERRSNGSYADALSLAVLRRGSPLRVVDYGTDFLAAYPHFLLAASPRHWIVRSLKESGYSLRPLAAGSVSLFQADAGK
jgi:hypothetical protein